MLCNKQVVRAGIAQRKNLVGGICRGSVSRASVSVRASAANNDAASVDRRQFMMTAASIMALSGVPMPAMADGDEYSVLLGLATPPTSYGASDTAALNLHCESLWLIYLYFACTQVAMVATPRRPPSKWP